MISLNGEGAAGNDTLYSFGDFKRVGRVVRPPRDIAHDKKEVRRWAEQIIERNPSKTIVVTKK